MSKPDKSDAAKTEVASPKAIEVKWRDLTFTVPPANEWDIDVAEAIENDRQVAIVQLLLGPEQYQQFRSSTPKPTIPDLGALSNAIAVAATGSTMGESEASSDS